MKVTVPDDHGATDILWEEEEYVVVRPHHFRSDTYIAGWYYFHVRNDTGRHLSQALIVIDELALGVYKPYWNHSVWSRDGEQWERIPDSAKQFVGNTMRIETPLGAGEGCWISVVFPLTYAWYEQLCADFGVEPVAGGWPIERRRLASSVELRPIYAYKVMGEMGKAGRNLLIVAGQHAVEESGKMFAENTLRGYHSGGFRGTIMEELLKTHNVTVVPVANPDGCYHGRMNSNVDGYVLDHSDDESVETRAILALIDELQPHVLINCHGWGNEVGELPHEDIYRFTDDDPLYRHLLQQVPGCSSSGIPHIFNEGVGRIETHAHEQYGTHCTITEVNYHWYLPPDGSPARQPDRADIDARIGEYLHAIAGFCMIDASN